MRLAMIATGGTIGSKTKQDGWIVPDTEAPYTVLQLFRLRYPEVASAVELQSSMPYQILSENLEAAYLIKLLDAVGDCIETEEYEGIIICHGTDTIQYTAAMLEFIYGNSDIPIMVVSSNYPLEDERANGLDNFRYAVQRIMDGYHGVGVVYRNADGNTYIHRGDQLLEHAAFEDDLHSIYGNCVGWYCADGVWVTGRSGMLENQQRVSEFTQRQSTDQGKEKQDLQKDSGTGIDMRRIYHSLRRESGILWIHNAPGIVYPELECGENIRAIMIQCYHAGTMRIDDAFRDFVQAMADRNIPVYLLGVERMQGGYETKQAYTECGVQILEGVAPIAAYCKLWLQISCDKG